MTTGTFVVGTGGQMVAYGIGDERYTTNEFNKYYQPTQCAIICNSQNRVLLLVFGDLKTS